jgi:hypothetical protein
MHFNGPYGPVEEIGYFPVAPALDDQSQHAHFGPGQRRAHINISRIVLLQYRFDLP